MFKPLDLPGFRLLISTCLALAVLFVAGAAQSQLAQAATAPGSTATSDLLIVQLAKDADRDKFDELLQETHGHLTKTINGGPNLQFFVIQAEPGHASEIEKHLKRSKEVALCERNRTYRACDEFFTAGRFAAPNLAFRFNSSHAFRSSRHLIPSDRFFFAEWDLAFMQFVPARSLGLPTNTPINFYFLDTGYAPSSDSPGIVAQYNFADPLNPSGMREIPADSGFHGTSTATVTASTDNRIGYAGAANIEGNRCVLVECRISNDGQSAGLVNILAALSSLLQSSGLPPGPVNLSFNASPPNTLNADPMIQQLAKQLSQRGFLLVLAAGNDGVLDASPEQFARRVGAINISGYLANFSETGNFPAAAPGQAVPVYTPLGPGREFLASGTSFSAPRWCAAIGNVMGVLSPANRNAVFADNLLLRTGTLNPQGYVIPNLQAALQAAAGQ